MIDYINKALYLGDSCDKQLKITCGSNVFTNSDLHGNTFTLTEALCSSEMLDIGACEASEVEFRISNVGSSLVGKTLTITETLNGDTANPFAIGTYKVYSDKPTADRSWRDIKAYDALYDILNANVATWYSGLDFPLTLKAFRNSFFEHMGIEQVDATLVNDSLSVEETISTTELSGQTVLYAICSLNGVFGHINREGKFTYIKLPKTDSYTPASYYGNVTYEDFTTPSITRLQLRAETDDIGVVVGTEGTDYVIEDNFLVYGKSDATLTTVANNILNVIKGITPYRPFECTYKGYPCAEVGDTITIETSTQTITSYILQRQLKGIQALTDDYSAQGTDTYLSSVNGTQSEINKLKGKTNTLTRTVDETVNQISEINKDLTEEGGYYERVSTLEQTTESISFEVSNLQKQVDGEVTVYTDLTEVPTLDNYPANEWFVQYYPPESDDEAEDYQFPSDNTWVYDDATYRQHIGSIAYVSGGTSSYKFMLENGSWVWHEIENSETAILENRVSALEIKSDSIESTVSEQTVSIANLTDEVGSESASGSILARLKTNESSIKQNASDISLRVTTSTYEGGISDINNNLATNYYTKTATDSAIKVSADAIKLSVSETYASKTDLANDYYTRTQADSAISQSATDITASVSKTYQTKSDASSSYKSLQASIDLKIDDEDLMSVINARADQIVLTGNQTINMKAGKFTLASQNTTITEDGTITCNALISNNATITGGSFVVETSNSTDTKIELKTKGSTGTHDCKFSSGGLALSFTADSTVGGESGKVDVSPSQIQLQCTDTKRTITMSAFSGTTAFSVTDGSIGTSIGNGYGLTTTGKIWCNNTVKFTNDTSVRNLAVTGTIDITPPVSTEKAYPVLTYPYSHSKGHEIWIDWNGSALEFWVDGTLVHTW